MKRTSLLAIIALVAVLALIALGGCQSKTEQHISGGLADIDHPPVENTAPEPEPATIDESSLEDIDFTRASFQWDTNDDGTVETVLVNYYKNGDEAPDAIGLTMGRNNDEGIIDNAYEIERVREGSDSQGPFLVIDYQYGDYYSHDDIARSQVRVVSGVFEAEPVQ